MENIGSFDAIVSSPPYLSAQDYYRSSKLEISILGLIPEKKLSSLGPEMIGSGRGSQNKNAIKDLYIKPLEINVLEQINSHAALVVANYLKDMAIVLEGCYKRLKKRGRCCLVIGDSKVRNIDLPVHKWTIAMAEKVGFFLKEHFIDIVKNRRVPPQRCGHSSIICKEHILVFEKERG